ncbi:polymer-forming cytoskeletal protein [Cytophagaceae bacterium ABcell3]|nr:polymer-forming cytoskeletal protein [Cytophagaceae bacterium ABcell3]
MFSKKDDKKIPEEVLNSRTIIAKGTLLEGNIETFGNIRVEGKLIGNVKCKSKVVLGDSSKVEGNILANTAEVEGEVVGVVEISDVLILKSTAIINGDIVTNKLVIESGATFNGKCKMGAVIKEIKIGENVEQTKQQPTIAKEKTA